MNYICLICHNPQDIWIDFLSKFIKYQIVVIIDDNNICYNTKYENVKFIQINDNICIENGFINMNHTIKKNITGWEKAMFYFTHIINEYDNVWFLEDDVFLYNETTLTYIDNKYPNSDLLTNNYEINTTGHKNNWHWEKITIHHPPPYYFAMVCAVRMSSKIMSKIKKYAYKNKTLYFLEALFPTIAKFNEFIYDTPEELYTITYNKKHDLDNINKQNLYHPFKDINDHIFLRNKLDNIL